MPKPSSMWLPLFPNTYYSVLCASRSVCTYVNVRCAQLCISNIRQTAAFMINLVCCFNSFLVSRFCFIAEYVGNPVEKLVLLNTQNTTNNRLHKTNKYEKERLKQTNQHIAHIRIKINSRQSFFTE